MEDTFLGVVLGTVIAMVSGLGFLLWKGGLGKKPRASDRAPEDLDGWEVTERATQEELEVLDAAREERDTQHDLLDEIAEETDPNKRREDLAELARRRAARRRRDP